MVPLDRASPRSSGREIFSLDSRVWVRQRGGDKVRKGTDRREQRKGGDGRRKGEQNNKEHRREVEEK